MGSVAQRQPQVSRGKAGTLAHHRFRARPFAVFDP
jgi:hypothetical protein